MKNKSGWKDDSNGELKQFNFSPPKDWTDRKIAEEQKALIDLFTTPSESNEIPMPDWFCLVMKLPSELKFALLSELNSGNQITGIGSASWPNPGSVVINMANRFTAARYRTPANVTWRENNDPHYFREELSQSSNSIEHLIIT